MKSSDVSTIVNKVLADYNLKKADVAADAGIAATELSNYTSGKKDFRVETFLRLLSALPPRAITRILATIQLEVMREYENRANTKRDSSIGDEFAGM